MLGDAELKIETERIRAKATGKRIIHVDDSGEIFMAYQKFRVNRRNNDHYVVHFKSNGKVRKKNKIKIKDKRLFLSFFHNGKKLYLLTYFTNSDKQKVYFFREEIDRETLAVKQESIESIFSFDLPPDNLKANNLYFDYRTNKAKNARFMVHMFNGKYDDKRPFSHSVACIDHNFNVVWKTDLLKSDMMEDDHYSYTISQFDDNGNLFLKVLEHPDLGKSKRQLAKSGIEVPDLEGNRKYYANYVCKLFVFYSKGEESAYDEHVIELPNGHKTGKYSPVSISSDDGRFRVVGSYSDFDYKFTKGFFITEGKIGEELNMNQTQLVEADLDLFLQNDRIRPSILSSGYHNDIEMGSCRDEAADLGYKSIVSHADGSLTLVAEIYKVFAYSTNSNGVVSTDYYGANMNVYFFHIDAEGALSWSRRIPKPNFSRYAQDYGSLIVVTSGNNLNLLYGYNKDNDIEPSSTQAYGSFFLTKKSKYVNALLDIKGNASYKKVATVKDLRGAIRTDYSYRQGNKTYCFIQDGRRLFVCSISAG